MRLALPFFLVLTAPLLARNIQPPSQLTVVDWRQIKAEYHRSLYTIFPDTSGFKAQNREQRFDIHFDAGGFDIRPARAAWHWGLSLTDQGQPRIAIQKNRATYTWDSGVNEKFINSVSGLEHTFTIAGKLASSELRLAIRGELHAQGSGTTITFVDDSGAARITYSGLRAWDADGHALPARMQANTANLHITFDDRGARYPITIDPLVQQAYLKPAAVGVSQALDGFGGSVAISGDTIVVGASGEDSDTVGVNTVPNERAEGGAAYVFVRVAGAWSQQAYLKPGHAAQAFGTSVAISGDTIVVGAILENGSNTGVNSQYAPGSTLAGAAFIFNRTGTVWSQQAYLKPAEPGNDSKHFGQAVGISGNLVVIGAPGWGGRTAIVQSMFGPISTFIEVGAAFVFERAAGLWSQKAILKPADVGMTQDDDAFGDAVAISGDTIVIGAPGEGSSSSGINSKPDEAAPRAGAAYVFVRSSGAWSQQAYLKHAADGFSHEAESLGASVAVSGDTAVVGAPGEGSANPGVNNVRGGNAIAAGAVYTFTRTGPVWKQEAFLKPAVVVAREGFSIVAIDGDTIVVGAFGNSSASLGVNSASVNTPNGALSGAVYVFTRTTGVWSQQYFLKPAAVGNTQQDDLLGNNAVAVSAGTVVAGAAGEDSSSVGVNSSPNEGASGAGAAYVWAPITPTITEVIDAGSLRPEISASAWVTIKGTRLASTTRIWVDKDFVDGKLPAALDGVSVTIDGKPAAVYYISPVQLNVLAAAIQHTGPVNVVVTTAEGIATFTATVKDRTPSWFMLDPENRKYVAAINLDGSIVGKAGLYPSAPNATKPLPARNGRALIYGTGWGVTNPVVPDGVVFSGAYPVTGATIKIGGVTVVIEFAGDVTPGLYQFNIVAPDLPPGDYLIEGAIGGATTQTGAYITLGPPN